MTNFHGSIFILFLTMFSNFSGMKKRCLTKKMLQIKWNLKNIPKFYFICNFFFSHVTLFSIPKKFLHILRNKIKKETSQLLKNNITWLEKSTIKIKISQNIKIVYYDPRPESLSSWRMCYKCRGKKNWKSKIF